MSLQEIPALQQEIKALKKQLKRAEEDHQVAIGKAGRQYREALEKADMNSRKAQGDSKEALDQAQQDLVRAHEDLQDNQDTLAHTLEVNQLLARQVNDLQRSQASAKQFSELGQGFQQFGNHKDKPVSEEHSSPVSHGKKPVPRASSTSDVVPRSTTGPESATQGRKELDAGMSASAERSEDKVVKSYATALTLKPQIPTSSEVLARRPSGDEVATTRFKGEGPMAHVFFGQQPNVRDVLRDLTEEEIDRMEAEVIERGRAELILSWEARQREKDLQRRATISGTLDTNSVTFQNVSTGPSYPVPDPNTAHEPEESRSSDLKRKAEAASVYMTGTSKKGRIDSGPPS